MTAGNDDAGPLIFLIAGEPSGDLLGARLMAALKTGGVVRFAGVGGPRMTAEGLDSLFPMAELSVMGVAEVLPHLPKLLGRITQTARAAMAARPAVVVTIDAPDFCFRVARKLNGSGIPIVHYVAPSVWAWRAGRARKIARLVDHVLCLLPFEPPYFERVGLAASFVGHSAVEAPPRGDGAGFRRRFALPDQAPLLCVLPGSRRGEVTRLLPIFAQTVARMAADRPGLRVVVPCIDRLRDEIGAAVADWPLPVRVVGGADKDDAFAAADVALAASGTVSLELGLAGVPHVIAYRLHPLTAFMARRLLQVDTVTLINLVLGRKTIPEFLQAACQPAALAAALGRLLDDPSQKASQLADAQRALMALGLGGDAPSARAAAVVRSVIVNHAAKA